MCVKNIIVIILVMFSVAGCATQPQKIDVLLLEKEAAQAYKAKKWQVAENKYTELIVLAPNSAEIWFRLGNVYAHTKRPDKAVVAYRESVIRLPAYEKAWHNLGIISLQQTTSLYLEMLIHLPHDSLQYKQAKEMAEDLVGLIEKRRKNNTQNKNVSPPSNLSNKEPVSGRQ